MTEEEKMVFWGELVEPIVALMGGLTVRGEFKLVEVLQDIVEKAENAALEEREGCAKVCESGTGEPIQFRTLEILRQERTRIAAAIRARGQG